MTTRMFVRQRFERIEAAYLAALAGRDPETVPLAIWRSAIFAAVPDTNVDEIIEMFRWRARKADRRWREFRERKLVTELVDGIAAAR